MALFTCPECGYQDNTAGSGYYELKRTGRLLVCSACNPAVRVTDVRAMRLRPSVTEPDGWKTDVIEVQDDSDRHDCHTDPRCCRTCQTHLSCRCDGDYYGRW